MTDTLKQQMIRTMQPLIGVVPLLDTHEGKAPAVLVQARYLDSIERAGGIPLVLPLLRNVAKFAQLLPLLDGFFLVGGHDINPTLYTSDPPSSTLGGLTPERDVLEVELVRYAFEHDVPTLGICRGMQMMNVALGGTLFQDIGEGRQSGALESIIPHFCEVDHAQDGNYSTPSHTVEVVPASTLARLFGHRDASPFTLYVNSMHHQAVRRVASGLVVGGICPDGVIESLEAPSRRFFVGVQWHPEYLLDVPYPDAMRANTTLPTVEELCGQKGTIDVLARALIKACQ
ncbi:MAG: gamma-glutamyl-gamma-aminobutyrate hydrolase family protein [Coriobacteriales bacterium]|jgi:putative glutamine amidotransferase|nr:gamma-glutamyl-gamma-aminobutyrate hydrolase family protein [Coriobacteriales bacterium]